MGKSLEFGRIYDNAARRQKIFLQEAEKWSRQLARDPRLHVSVVVDSTNPLGERYHDYVDEFSAEQLFDWPDMKLLRTDRTAATSDIGPCSAVIISGDIGSSHWIFGHLTMGNGFPDFSLLEQAKKGLSGKISALVIGGAPMFNREKDEAYHRKQIETVMEQLHDVGLPVDPDRMKTYWNTTQFSFNNVVARIDKKGNPWVHVELVYTLAAIF